jgi:hypothetical protein
MILSVHSGEESKSPLLATFLFCRIMDPSMYLMFLLKQRSHYLTHHS